mmetsp:Transcript_9442/g.10666  ORF Transcript_9442/g.10666 Transcript_9442/m.10666 type:complete len:213 (-) Transcript_9442:487-1125(-)
MADEELGRAWDMKAARSTFVRRLFCAAPSRQPSLTFPWRIAFCLYSSLTCARETSVRALSSMSCSACRCASRSRARYSATLSSWLWSAGGAPSLVRRTDCSTGGAGERVGGGVFFPLFFRRRLAMRFAGDLRNVRRGCRRCGVAVVAESESVTDSASATQSTMPALTVCRVQVSTNDRVSVSEGRGPWMNPKSSSQVYALLNLVKVCTLHRW